MDKTLNGLIHSRKFWLAVWGVAQAVILYYLDVPDEILVSVTALVIAVIGGITVEDSAAKIGNGRQ